jgi:hypothetical protein
MIAMEKRRAEMNPSLFEGLNLFVSSCELLNISRIKKVAIKNPIFLLSPLFSTKTCPNCIP